MSTELKMALAAARLARAFPTIWQEFVAAYQEHHHSFLSQLVRSDADQLPQLQGRAREVTAFLDLLQTCVRTADAHEAKAKK